MLVQGGSVSRVQGGAIDVRFRLHLDDDSNVTLSGSRLLLE
jgi:hypothetical protein